jgi:hypothetical protein
MNESAKVIGAIRQGEWFSWANKKVFAGPTKKSY